MGRKNIQESYDMFAGSSGQAPLTDMSTNQTSYVTSVKNQDKASIIVNWSGTAPIGVLTVEARNKKENLGPDSGWVVLEFGSPINITGNTGSHTLIFNELQFTEIRLVYTRTSGTGTINAFIGSKTVGS
jgi:hypothetical protein